MIRKLEERLIQAQHAVLVKSKSESIADIRLAAGIVEGLRQALAIVLQDEKELNDGTKSKS